MTALFLRDLRLSVRAGGGALIGILFFLTVVAVIPFGVGPDLKLLSRIGPAIVWIGALLSALLGLDRLFQAERDDGSTIGSASDARRTQRGRVAPEAPPSGTVGVGEDSADHRRRLNAPLGSHTALAAHGRGRLDNRQPAQRAF